jgi:hypothetical protein
MLLNFIFVADLGMPVWPRIKFKKISHVLLLKSWLFSEGLDRLLSCEILQGGLIK